MKERGNQLKCCSVWQDCAPGDKKRKKKHQTTSHAFVFWARECVRRRDRQKLCVRGVLVRLGIHFFNCLWSHPRLWSNSLRMGGWEPSRSHRKFTLQLGLAKNCDLHNLFFKLLKCRRMRRSLGAQETHPSAWQHQWNTPPLHICSQLQLEERQRESL